MKRANNITNYKNFSSNYLVVHGSTILHRVVSENWLQKHCLYEVRLAHILLEMAIYAYSIRGSSATEWLSP